MAQHKAPTAVSLARTSEKTGFALFVDQYWKPAALLAALITVGIVFFAWRDEQKEGKRAESWNTLLAIATPDAMGGLTGAPSELRAVAGRLEDTDAGPWALFIAAKSALEKREFDVAMDCANELKTRFPQHSLVKDPVPFSDGAAPQSAVDELLRKARDQKTWDEGHATLFKNPDPPADAPKVKLHTDKGDLVVQLYPNLAPKHVENFLRLAREGFYTGTKFHRVQKDALIQGGDPNTKDADTAKWGLGGPEAGIELEPNDLRHFEGVLSMWKAPGQTTSSGSQFVITLAPQHAMDGQYEVFGKVIEGLDTAKTIASGSIAAGTERPEDPVAIQSTEVL